MMILHGLLAKLGIDAMPLDALQETADETEWIVDQKFVPITGRRYEIAYGKLPYHGRECRVLRRIQAGGTTPDSWLDLDTQALLDPELQRWPVRGFRPLP